jgi:hypothetical protein
MTQAQLEELTREELITLILAQSKQLVRLQADYEALQVKLDKLQKPPTSSSNSSQPASLWPNQTTLSPCA